MNFDEKKIGAGVKALRERWARNMDERYGPGSSERWYSPQQDRHWRAIVIAVMEATADEDQQE